MKEVKRNIFIFSNTLVVQIAMIEKLFRIYRVSIGFFPFFYYLCHVSIGDLLISHMILEGIGAVLCEEEINDSAHKYVQYQHIWVSILEDHKSSGQEHPDNHNKSDHWNYFLYHSHIRAAFLILVKNWQCVTV